MWLEGLEGKAHSRKESPAKPYLLHQHLHVVGAASAVRLHDEAKTQCH